MICPVEIARDMSAFQAVRVRDPAKYGFLPEGRDGAGNESTGSNLAGDGETDHVVAGSALLNKEPRSPYRESTGCRTSSTHLARLRALSATANAARSSGSSAVRNSGR